MTRPCISIVRFRQRVELACRIIAKGRRLVVSRASKVAGQARQPLVGVKGIVGDRAIAARDARTAAQVVKCIGRKNANPGGRSVLGYLELVD